MYKNTNNLQLICALATWRTLRQKQISQYDVIAVFCKCIVKKYYEYKNFRANDVAEKLKMEYGFEIIDSIIQTVLTENLKNYLHQDKKEQLFYLKQNIDVDENVDILANDYIRQYKNFSKEIVVFIKNKINKHKTKKNPTDEAIMQVFNTFLLDNKYLDENKFLFPYFTEFLNKNNEKYKKMLQTIKEGLILYDGLKYNIYNAKRVKHNPKIILFLDTEILFSAIGYNEQMYEKKFRDFYDLVCKYDIDGLGLRMPLFYTENTEQEIKNFFYTAREIKEKGNANYERKVAMEHLLKKSKNADEIVSEETFFFHSLEKKFKIKKYTLQSYEDLLKTKQSFNLEAIDSINNIKKSIKNKRQYSSEKFDKEIDNAIKILSFINMFRGKYPNNFFDSGVFFITNTWLVNYIAWHSDIMQDKTIPLSNTLDFISARLWEFLETSLGQSTTLESFNPIFNIQIALQDMIVSEVARQYERAQQNFEENNDKELYEKEILNIHETMNLNPSNKRDLEEMEILFSVNELEEARKLNIIRENRKYEEGRQEEREQKNKELEKLTKALETQKNKIRELKRKDIKRTTNYYFVVIKRKIKKYYIRVWNKIKNHHKAIIYFIVSIVASIVATVIYNKLT